MNQEKIGKFISLCRKEKGLTQENLAEKLGVSKNAVSKWERGICLMDMSLLKPLCEILEISINELLSGEKIIKEKIEEKLEENLVNTIEYSTKKISKKNRTIKYLGLTFITLILILITLFIIDINRMRNNKPVFFSTWGFSYAPPVNLSEEKISRAVEIYLKNEEHHRYENSHTFISMETYLIEEKNNMINVYVWALIETYYEKNGEVKQESGSSIPYKITLKKDNNEYIVTDYQIPKDGSYYVSSMKKLFPYLVRNKMNKVYQDGTIERLSYDIQNQVEDYYRLNNILIEKTS